MSPKRVVGCRGGSRYVEGIGGSVSWFVGFLASWLLGFWFLGFLGSWFQIVEVSRFLGFLVS